MIICLASAWRDLREILAIGFIADDTRGRTFGGKKQAYRSEIADQ